MRAPLFAFIRVTRSCLRDALAIASSERTQTHFPRTTRKQARANIAREETVSSASVAV